jgi:hypothetical protein
MKNIILFVCLVVSFQMFGQVPTGFQYRRVNERIQGKFMVDSMGYMARYSDTTAANLHMLIDTCGAHFFSYATNTVWVRACSPKHWIEVGSGGGIGTLDTLLPRLNQWDVVQNAAGTSYKSHREIVYNVKDYGATGDGVTDDQPAIQRAIDSCHSQGGGVVYFPNGIYLLTSTAQSLIHLLIPVSAQSNTDTAVTVELRGETPPIMWTNPLVDAATNGKPPLTGAILLSSVLNSTAILSTNLDGSGGANFCNVIIKNLGFRVRSKTGATQVAPQGVAIDGSKLAMMQVDNVRLDTESPRDSTVMPNTTCTGINFPRTNNWCQINFTNSLITGYYKALVVGEHFKSNNCELDGNYKGLTTYGETQYHPIEIAQMGFWRNAYNISLDGTGRISITNAIFEDDTIGTPWFEFVADLEESPGGFSGGIGFAKVYTGSGAYDQITRSNPTNSYISTWPIVNPTEVTGYAQGLMKNLGVGDQASMGYQSTGNSGTMKIGQISSTYSGFLDLAANDGYLSAGNGDMMLMTTGSKIKVGIGSFSQTHEINSSGFKYASSTYGAFLGIGGPAFPGVWLKGAADAPSASNYTLAESSSLTLLSGPSGIHAEVGNDITNGLLFDANKRLGIGFAYNGSPTASLHIRAGTSSASTAPLKFTAGTNLATTEAGAIEYDGTHLYYTATNAGTRYQLDQQAKPSLNKGVFVASPTSADTIDVWQTPVAITITSLKAILRGTSPSVTYNIAFGTNIQSPTAVFTADITCTSVTTGCSNSSGFNDATIPAGSFIWIYTNASSGTIRSIAFTINYTED